MPVFFFFNNDVANLFAPGHDGRPQALRHRDMSMLFPAMLFMGSLSGVPQLVLPLGLYMLFGPQANVVDNAARGTYVKAAAVALIAMLMFWDFLPSFAPENVDYEERRPDIRRRGSPAYRVDEISDDGMVVSALSEMSLVLLISITLAILSHWEDVHAWIARTLPRGLARRFRQATRVLGIHPTNASQGLRPAAPQTIESLETISITGTGQGDCSICLETFKTGETAKKLRCGHKYHGHCILPWLNQRSSCPVCRRSIEADDNEEDFHHQSNSTQQHTRNDGSNAVWNALRSVLDPSGIFNQPLRVEDRTALMQLSIRELRERARARNIQLRGVVEKSEIVDLLLGDTTQ